MTFQQSEIEYSDYTEQDDLCVCLHHVANCCAKEEIKPVTDNQIHIMLYQNITYYVNMGCKFNCDGNDDKCNHVNKKDNRCLKWGLPSEDVSENVEDVEWVEEEEEDEDVVEEEEEEDVVEVKEEVIDLVHNEDKTSLNDLETEGVVSHHPLNKDKLLIKPYTVTVNTEAPYNIIYTELSTPSVARTEECPYETYQKQAEAEEEDDIYKDKILKEGGQEENYPVLFRWIYKR